jgi:hypothetical protein
VAVQTELVMRLSITAEMVKDLHMEKAIMSSSSNELIHFAKISLLQALSNRP